MRGHPGWQVRTWEELTGLASNHKRVTSQTPGQAKRLTAVSLVAHVATVVVKVAPPNAVDTVPVAAAVLVTETGVLWPRRQAEEETKPILFLLLDRKTLLF